MLTLKDAIESFVTEDNSADRIYGRLLAAVGESMQGWINDEIQRGSGDNITEVFSALVRVAAGMISSVTSRTDMDIETGADLLGQLLSKSIVLSHTSIREMADDDLAAILQRAQEQEGMA